MIYVKPENVEEFIMDNIGKSNAPFKYKYTEEDTQKAFARLVSVLVKKKLISGDDLTFILDEKEYISFM